MTDLLECRDLAVVKAGERQQRGCRPQERHEHVLLSVPLIALRAQEGVGAFAADQGGPPFHQLVDRADREAWTKMSR
jgi:hypothetical protein